ncbi:sulfite exporter TauE/SafE family protein [Ectothiorhodospira lacustris]|uniref:sulfite exporter TauE/SafE family protein n=1 Tax=Ectothiorhodospira lacustris TaxID=2899127 RepID=UPI001EE7D60D|nr:sulfite exporter TauE/SafE family protein [Ectothiorhodospira lacustris]MCG5500135.1 sulfite exporter TauE/SafE family protein [Ectothiorhodospira lacustris]MCG5510780.1 sulfite exporter TauE/SafE family protein [Ectothiorhodospira lacustris]MCG5522512.1 sulfite exporter TauE/SafE family protein [Ectothiorhodospira lacustris]
MEPGTLIAAFVIGLLGGVHCIGMCGGIVGALTLGIRGPGPGARLRPAPFLLAYNLGRVMSYTLAGALAGGLGWFAAHLADVNQAQQGLQILAGLFMIALGLYLAGWWRGLVYLERAGGMLWRRLEPLGRRVMPVRSPPQALALGLVWGWLPCGLVYSVLFWSLTAGGAVQGAALMLAFGLGTLPNLLLMGVFAARLATVVRKAWVRGLAGAAVAGYGVYMLFATW